MKIVTAIAMTIAATALTSTAHAALVKYKFTGSQVNEQYEDYSQVPTAKMAFANNTNVSVWFWYDAATPVTAANVPPSSVGSGGNFGNMSVYDNAAKLFAGSIANYHFSASAGRGLVANALPGSSSRDGVFLRSGTPDLDFPAITGSNFQGFQKGGYTLVGLNLWRVGSSDILSSQALPGSLTTKTFTNNGLYLTFVDANNTQIWAQFSGTFSLAPVPLPAAAWLFGSALAGLAGSRLRRARAAR